jgi:deoxyribodipyrimidine photo-lyase
MVNHPFKPSFSQFPWQKPNDSVLEKWQQGKTGYPLVDAGMRQLWQTGWMHNRVRMVVASFLTKHLRLHWQYGADWFWDTLVDADLANNIAGWQWVAGCGADAAPYFRIFNPITQSEKFDKDGAYIRTYLPELAKLPTHFIHAPWLASTDVLREAGIELGVTYPLPMVDHKTARDQALAAYSSINLKAPVEPQQDS